MLTLWLYIQEFFYCDWFIKKFTAFVVYSRPFGEIRAIGKVIINNNMVCLFSLNNVYNYDVIFWNRTYVWLVMYRR